MHDATIVVDGLRKRFGSTLALDGMSLTVSPGLVTGFVGPNGSGKSTTMRVILGLDAADAGTALVGGVDYRRLRRPLCRVGSLLDAGALQPGRWLLVRRGRVRGSRSGRPSPGRRSRRPGRRRPGPGSR